MGTWVIVSEDWSKMDAPLAPFARQQADHAHGEVSDTSSCNSLFFQLDKPHGRPRRCLGNRLGVAIIVLLRPS